MNMSSVKRDIVNEIYKYARKNFPRRHVIQKDIDDLWQADLMDMQTISKNNSNFKYILVIIDTFSKYGWVIPLKQKNKENVTYAFSDLILQQQRCPKNLQTDMGTEFYNDKFKTFLKTHAINHYSTFSIKKASIVERFIRTIKTHLYKEFGIKGNYKWIDGTLNKVIERYNNTKHRTINIAPAHVNNNNKTILLTKFNENCFKKPEHMRAKFKLGDYVRISKHKSCFEKGYTPNWSTELFKIKTVRNTNPVTYLIEDIKQQPIMGAFYGEELQKTKHPQVYLIEKILRQKGNKMFVKWLGLPTNENSWILKECVV